MSEINQEPHLSSVEINKSNENVNDEATFSEQVDDLQIDSERDLITDNPNRCIRCNRLFTSPKRLENHLKTHENNRIFTCITCDKTFTRSDRLTRHLKLHSPNPEIFPCTECGKKFNRKDNLQAHQKIHLGVASTKKTCLCEYCGLLFNSSDLIVHLRRHEGKTPYKCSTCNKGFSQSYDLKCHKRIHTGEKPYACSICGKAFTRSNKLLRHLHVHTGQKPYCCKVCDKRFTRLNDRNIHMRIHTGEKPYFCGDCPERFRQSSQLKTHKRKFGHTTETIPDLTGGYRVRLVASTSGETAQLRQNNHVDEVNNPDRVEEEQPAEVNGN